MKISYAITACNEVEETIRLVNQLLNYKGENSEIVVMYNDLEIGIIKNRYLNIKCFNPLVFSR